MRQKATGGWTGKLLRVDLSTGSISAEDTIPYGQRYMGGRGIGARIGWDEIPPGVGPFDPENRIIFAPGPLTGTSAPESGRTTIYSLSPQAYPYEWFSYSNIGGYWGPALKQAGYDAVIVQGEAPQPAYLWVDDDRVELRDASAVWGQGTFATQQELMNEHGADVRLLTIGQAGENRCRIAIVASGTGSAAGQGGFGAVMGAKRLKALVVRGTKGVPVAHPEAFAECTRSIAQEVHATMGCPETPQLDPELAAKYRERFMACSQQCAMRSCWLSRAYSNVPGVVHPDRSYSGTIVCESALFGGVPDTGYDWKVGFQAGFELAQISQDFGLNHWELGIGMAPWLQRCYQEGLLKDFDGQPVDLDSPYWWDTLFRKITFREGIGEALAEGAVRASHILGVGEDLVREYFTAWGFAGHWDGHGDRINRIVFPYWLVTALQWSVSTRDPLSSGHGYAQNIMNWSLLKSPTQGLDWETLADVGAKFYGTRQAVHPASGYEAKALPALLHGHRSVMKDSLTLCDQVFPRIYSNKTPDHFARSANGMPGPSFEYHMFRLATGMDLDEAEFEQMAERVFNLERALQIRNWNRSREVDEQVIPHFETVENWVNPTIGEGVKLDRAQFVSLMDQYYTLRGWDTKSGRPTRAKLDELGLSDVADQLAEQGRLP
ncbi:MAG: hypothetical protein GX601_08110 [Anaerolineales bacterium]|nr:hypothetical protein [Anaerolineales bacterium]